MEKERENARIKAENEASTIEGLRAQSHELEKQIAGKDATIKAMQARLADTRVLFSQTQKDHDEYLQRSQPTPLWNI